MSPTLNKSSALQHFECSNVVEICNQIMFDFYPGLPHIHQVLYHVLYKTVIFSYISQFSLQLCTTYATNFIVKTQVEALYTHMRVSYVIRILFVLPVQVWNTWGLV